MHAMHARTSRCFSVLLEQLFRGLPEGLLQGVIACSTRAPPPLQPGQPAWRPVSAVAVIPFLLAAAEAVLLIRPTFYTQQHANSRVMGSSLTGKWEGKVR